MINRSWLFVSFAIAFIYVVHGLEAAPVLQIQSGDGTWLTNGSAYDFPATSSGASVSRGFTVFNDGNSVLTISNPASVVTGAGFTQHSNVVLSSTIQPGSSSAFRIVFSHSSPGDFTGTVRLQTNGGVFQFTIRAHVNPSPSSSIRIVCGDGTPIQNGGTYNFPPVDPNQFIARGFTVYNDGTATLTISNPGSVLVSSGKFNQHPSVSLSSSIPPSSSSAFRIQFQSSESGLFSAVVSLQNNDPDDNPFQFTLTASVNPPPVPEILVKAQDGTDIERNSTYVMPNTTTGSSIEKQFMLFNAGSAVLSIDNPSSLVSGTNFTQTDPQPNASIVQGGSTLFTVRFVSNTAGTFTGAVSVESNDPDDDPFIFSIRVNVSMAGTPAIRVVAGDGTVMANGSTYPYPDTPTDVAMGRAFTVHNTGTSSLHIYNPASLVTGNGFGQLSNVILSPDISPGADSAFRIRLLSSTPGAYTAQIRIESNDPDDSPFIFTVTGRVVGATPKIRVVVGDGTVLSNGGQYVYPPVGKNTLISRGFSVYNDGNASLQISNAGNLVSGSNFIQHPNVILASTIEASSSSAFRVQFQAASSGPYNSTVTIHSNDAQSPVFTFDLLAEVREPDFALGVTPASRTILQGERAEYTVSLESSYGFDSPVSLSITGLPNAAIPVFNPQTIRPGETSRLVIQTGTNTPAVHRSLDITGTSGTIVKITSVQLRIEDLVLKPAIISTEPRYVPQRSSTILTLTGVNLQNAIAEIGMAKRSSDDPDRFYPGVQLLSISADGTEMHVQVIAVDPRVLGYYALYITTPGGRYGTGFRVIPDSPVVDFWTPSEVANGSLYALDLVGVNLAGAAVIPNNPGIEVMDIDNSDDEYLSGYLVSISGEGPFSLTVRGKNGRETLVHVQARAKMQQVVRKTEVVLSASDGAPVLFYQPLVSSADMKTSGFNSIEDKGLDDFDFCFNWGWKGSRGRIFSKTLFKSPVDNVWRPVLDSLLSQLQPGVSKLLQTQTFTRWFFISVDVTFLVCIRDNVNYVNFDFSICLAFESGFNIPIIGGVVISGGLCNGGERRFDITGTGFLSFIQFHKYNSTGVPLDCTEFKDVTLIPGAGERTFEVTPKDCCSEEIAVSYGGDFYISPIEVNNQRAGTFTPQNSCQGEVRIKIAAFIPYDHVIVPFPQDICIPGRINARIHKGDDRGFNPHHAPAESRISQIAIENPAGTPDILSSMPGPTYSFGEDALLDQVVNTGDIDHILLDCFKLHSTGFTDISDRTTNFILDQSIGDVVQFKFGGSGANPLVLISPPVDWAITVSYNKRTRAFAINGDHDLYPAYEIAINDRLVYGYLPSDRMPGLINLNTQKHINCGGILGNEVCGQQRTAPMAVDDAVMVLEDKSTVIPVLVNDFDPDRDALALQSITQPLHGKVTAGTDATVTYVPAQNYHGPDSFSYTITDGEIVSTATVAVTVDGANDSPIANNDSASTKKGIPVVVPVLLNDTDPDGQPVTLLSVGAPAHGTTVKNSDGTVTYSPTNNYSGPDSFTYIITDGFLKSEGTVKITVIGTAMAKDEPGVFRNGTYLWSAEALE